MVSVVIPQMFDRSAKSCQLNEQVQVLLVCRYIRLSISTCNVKRTAEDIRIAGGTVLRETTMRTLKGQDAPVRPYETYENSRCAMLVHWWNFTISWPHFLIALPLS